MTCEELDDLIEAIVEGDPVAPAAEAHLAGCARCRARVELSRAIGRLLLSRERPAPADGFTAQVLRRVRQERWRVEQAVDAGFNLAIAAGVIVLGCGAVALLWSLGLVSIDLAALATATRTMAPWTAELAGQAQTLVLAALLLATALALWWWVEGGAV